MNQDENVEVGTNNEVEKDHRYMKIKKFHFIMILFLLVFLTAGITTFALSVGEEKPIERIQIKDREEFTKLYQTYEQLLSMYIEELDRDVLIEGAINGMVEAVGDPYTDYMTIEEAKKFYESISSSFEGIGATVEERDGNITIVTPLKGSPAEAAGLKPNDIILEVDGKSIQGMSSTEAVLLIRGEKGTEVELTISRPGIKEPLKIKIVRDVIPIETVYSEMTDNKIGIIHITSFSERTYDELVEHLDELKKQGMVGLVLDLRQNPGGLLTQAIKIASHFVPNGEVIYQIEDRNGNRTRQLSNQKDPFDIPMVVVVDEGSASASEIVAAALKESKGVPVVGVKTFGKGTAQSAGEFEDGSNLKITTSKWLTPSGNSINKNGIQPDVEVKLPEYASLPYVDPSLELKKDMIGNEIKVIEQMLQALGYEVGKVDGIYDETLKKAVLKFQKDNKLEETGIVIDDTTRAIMQKLSDKITAEDPQIQKAKELLQSKSE